MDDHLLTTGVGANYSTFNTVEPDVSDGRHSTTLLWGFLQDEVELIKDELFWTMGARFDRHSTMVGCGVL